MPISRRWLVATVVFVAAACSSPGSPPPASPEGSAAVAPTTEGSPGPTILPGCAALEAPPNEGRGHLAADDSWQYQGQPPTSGPHYVTAADPGWYDEAPPPEELVHSLEHGFIVMYRSGLEPSDEAALHARFDDLVEEGFGGLISVPDESILDPMTLTAWDRLQRCVRADPDALEGFVREHYAQAPEATLACGFDGAASLPACEAILSASPAPTREPTEADQALLERIPEPLRDQCRPSTAFAAGADAGWDCFGPSGGLAYGYAGFPDETSRDAFFEGIVAALAATEGGDCAADEASLSTYRRDDGTTGRLACATSGQTRSRYWTVDGTGDLAIAVALDDTDLQAFWEQAGPAAVP